MPNHADLQFLIISHLDQHLPQFWIVHQFCHPILGLFCNFKSAHMTINMIWKPLKSLFILQDKIRFRRATLSAAPTWSQHFSLSISISMLFLISVSAYHTHSHSELFAVPPKHQVHCPSTGCPYHLENPSPHPPTLCLLHSSIVSVGLACMSSHVQLFVTQWTVACQASLSIGFPRREYWSGLLFPPPGDLPDPGIEPLSPTLNLCLSLTLAGRFFTTDLGSTPPSTSLSG